ncbi:lipase chaperone [Trinickia dinghuensis]|uniref:Lipase chaperone n=2 Tax=Trinickia dinghuensis TaxID=2291023 RepID=A0A3D8K7X4_9BURK|nr:lipase chaperone [Trinickia dinghuensis]
MRPADAKKTAGTLALFGLAGFAAAAVVWYFNAPARAPHAGAQPIATAAAAPLAQAARAGSIPAAPSLPGALAGSMPPRLPLDERGHLRKARSVRDFFDYFLTAQNQMPHKALDALVHQEIAAQLDGTVAEPEALDVWQRYQAYLKALGSLDMLSAQAPADAVGRTSDLDAMQSSLDQRAALASRTLGPDWNEAFFGPDWRHAHYMIERWRVQRDPTLTDAQKAARLQALEESLPPQERAALDRDRHAQAQVHAVAQLAQQGMTLDQLRAQATQKLGPQAAERIVKMQQDNDAWHAKYADYAAQRARIDAMGLSAADRDAQVAQLRQRVFTDPAQALRAAALDGGAGH